MIIIIKIEKKMSKGKPIWPKRAAHFHMGVSAPPIQASPGPFQLSEDRLFFFHRKVRARPDNEGPLKSSWSVWRPQVVWTFLVGEDLMKPKEVLRWGEVMDCGLVVALELVPTLCLGWGFRFSF